MTSEPNLPITRVTQAEPHGAAKTRTSRQQAPEDYSFRDRTRVMSSRLSEKVCIITGTGGSIGREAARTFAREGGLVVGCDLTVDGAET